MCEITITRAPTSARYTLSLHDALPIWARCRCSPPTPAARNPPSTWRGCCSPCWAPATQPRCTPGSTRSEEHTSELQSRGHLVCRLLLEKKKHIEKRVRGRAV